MYYGLCKRIPPPWHEQWRGKIEVVEPMFPVDAKEDLALAYTPGSGRTLSGYPERMLIRVMN